MNQSASSMPADDIAGRLARVQEEIKRTCESAGRNSDEIVLVAVSKGHPFAAVEKAYTAGQRHFGESYAQEMLEKIKESQKKAMIGITWHFIGAIQSNKIKIIAQADVVQSIDSIKHAQLLNDSRTQSIDVFLQVNQSEESHRRGFLEKEINNALHSIRALDRLNIKGLMTILPLQPLKPAHYWFERMRLLRDELQRKHEMPLALSMGMSNDFPQAIAGGASIVRVGSSIFGPRAKL